MPKFVQLTTKNEEGIEFKCYYSISQIKSIYYCIELKTWKKKWWVKFLDGEKMRIYEDEAYIRELVEVFGDR